MSSIGHILTGAAAFCAAAFCVSAAAAEPEDGLSGTWSLQVENDRIVATDRHYTNGLRLSWVSDKTTDGPKWVRDALYFLYPLADMRAGRVGFALGQNIYTPEDTDAVALVRDDRPYAGWLYGAVSLHAETTRNKTGDPLDVLDSVELNFGVVGPLAFGEEVQNQWHDLIGVSRANGWDNQLENEPALALFFERKWRPAPLSVGGLEADVIPHVGGSLGNVFTLANVGATVRLGQALWVDYGPPHIRPSLSGLPAVETNGDFAWYLFAGAEGRIVAHNIFLDGNTFADSHDVSKKTLVGSLQAGVSLVYGGVNLSYSTIYLSREFDGQSEADIYGTLSISTRF